MRGNPFEGWHCRLGTLLVLKLLGFYSSEPARDVWLNSIPCRKVGRFGSCELLRDILQHQKQGSWDFCSSLGLWIEFYRLMGKIVDLIPLRTGCSGLFLLAFAELWVNRKVVRMMYAESPNLYRLIVKMPRGSRIVISIACMQQIRQDKRKLGKVYFAVISKKKALD